MNSKSRQSITMRKRKPLRTKARSFRRPNKRRASRIIHVTVRASSNSRGSSPIFKPMDNVSKMTADKSTAQNTRAEQSYRPQSIHLSKIQTNVILLFDRLENRDTSEINQLTIPNKRRWPVWILILITFALLLLCTGITAVLVFFLVPNQSKSIVSTPALRWNRTGITVAGRNGITGSGNQELNLPWGLAISHSYSLYVADHFNNRIQKFVRDSTIGVTVAGQSNGVSNNTNATLRRPAAILLDSDENLYIADAYSFRVMFWRKNALAGNIIAGMGGYGNRSDQLKNVYGIARNPSTETMYVADYENDRVMSYNKYATTGSLIAGNNGTGLNSSRLDGPMWVLFDQVSNSLLISNLVKNNILRWKLGDDHWTLVVGSIAGIAGNTSTLINGARSFAMDPMGNLYVADRRNHRIQFFSTDQSEGTTIIGINGQLGNSSHLLYEPFGIALDNQLNVYVADSENNRVQKFLRY